MLLDLEQKCLHGAAYRETVGKITRASTISAASRVDLKMSATRPLCPR